MKTTSQKRNTTKRAPIKRRTPIKRSGDQVQISIVISQAILDELVRIAAHEARSRNSQIAYFLEYCVKKHEDREAI